MNASTRELTMNTVLIGASAMAVLAPGLAHAHSQYASATLLSGFMHPLIGFDHLLAMVTVGIWAARMGGRALWVVPGAFLVAVAAGWLSGHAGLSIPVVQPMVAATVLVLALFVLLDVRAGALLGAALVAVFAVFHGVAHVEGARASAIPVFYLTGFMLATAVLHLAGIAVALTLHRRVTLLRLGAAPVALTGAWLLVTRLG